jgi:uncharacterized protein YbcI
MNEQERPQRVRSDITREISEHMGRLQSEYYGRGPLKAKSYYTDDLVVVRLDETFTRAEKTLLDRGEKDTIQMIRRRFQQHMESEFKAIIEQATGREVTIFLSETNIEKDVSVEIFFLGSDLTDMRGYE